jgi:hypothetical protein
LDLINILYTRWQIRDGCPHINSEKFGDSDCLKLRLSLKIRRGTAMRSDSHFTAIQRVSLRGSLAGDYMRKCAEPGVTQKQIEEFIFKLSLARDARLLKYYDENGILVIGKTSEQGYFPPDW